MGTGQEGGTELALQTQISLQGTPGHSQLLRSGIAGAQQDAACTHPAARA